MTSRFERLLVAVAGMEGLLRYAYVPRGGRWDLLRLVTHTWVMMLRVAHPGVLGALRSGRRRLMARPVLNFMSIVIGYSGC